MSAWIITIASIIVYLSIGRGYARAQLPRFKESMVSTYKSEIDLFEVRMAYTFTWLLWPLAIVFFAIARIVEKDVGE